MMTTTAKSVFFSTMTQGESSQARKRRKAIREGKEEVAESIDIGIPSADALDPNDIPLEKKTIETTLTDGQKKTTQIRYDPSVPMSKEQLAAWRREARRVRNRQSAAASREKIRNRIQELEDEASQWKQKYEEAARRLEELQSQARGDSNQSDAFV